MVKNQSTTRVDKALTSPTSVQVEIDEMSEAIKPVANSRFLVANKFDTSDSDIIDDLLARVIALAPGFSAALAAQVNREIRDRWACERPYISRRAGEGRSTRNEQIKRDYLAGERMALLERRYQLKSTRLWEIIKD
ncbi:MAG: hypothetical protein Q7U05_01065 [Polaromonas sp.]|nr:hypothetical protein [Polaromonas sp.]